MSRVSKNDPIRWAAVIFSCLIPAGLVICQEKSPPAGSGGRSAPDRAAFKKWAEERKPGTVTGKLVYPERIREQAMAYAKQAFELPLCERGIGDSGVSGIHYLDEASPGIAAGESILKGFTFRVPESVKGDLLVWYFFPDGLKAKRNIVTPKVYSPKDWLRGNVVRNTPRIQRNSWLARKHPAILTERAVAFRFEKKDLIPGQVHALVFSRRPSVTEPIGVAFNFTDGINQELEPYLPVHLGHSLVD